MTGELEGKRVLITGASSGIGAATARAFASAGATVGLAARRTDRLDEVLTGCRRHAPASRAFTVDLSDLDGIAAFAARANDELGGIDVLVNNAGVPKRRRMSEAGPEDIEGVMAMNFFSPARLTLALLPTLTERNGHIVNVSSMGAHSMAFRIGAYAASKASLEFFTESLYLELKPKGVGVHLFVPGSTVTEFSTPKDGNDPPFPQDPSTMANADDVAAALLGCLSTDRFVTFARPSDQAVAERKNGDVNAFLDTFFKR